MKPGVKTRKEENLGGERGMWPNGSGVCFGETKIHETPTSCYPSTSTEFRKALAEKDKQYKNEFNDKMREKLLEGGLLEESLPELKATGYGKLFKCILDAFHARKDQRGSEKAVGYTIMKATLDLYPSMLKDTTTDEERLKRFLPISNTMCQFHGRLRGMEKEVTNSIGKAQRKHMKAFIQMLIYNNKEVIPDHYHNMYGIIFQDLFSECIAEGKAHNLEHVTKTFLDCIPLAGTEFVNFDTNFLEGLVKEIVNEWNTKYGKPTLQTHELDDRFMDLPELPVIAKYRVLKGVSYKQGPTDKTALFSTVMGPKPKYLIPKRNGEKLFVEVTDIDTELNMVRVKMERETAADGYWLPIVKNDKQILEFVASVEAAR